MSRIVSYDLPCPKCKYIDKYNVYHSLNLMMTPEAAELIKCNEVNFFTCKNCQNRFQVKCSLFFVNNVKQYCLHYSPKGTIDESEKEVKENLKRMFGDNFFIANPIKFEQWEDFKNEVLSRELISERIENKSVNNFGDYVINRLTKGRFNAHSKSWSCSICDGDETTGCLFHDPSECPKFT